MTSPDAFEVTRVFFVENLKYDSRVLLVEDDPVARWQVRNAIKDHCIISTATTAALAMQKFIELKPNLVFLDIDLPDKDGRQILDWIMDISPRTVVVMLSSYDHPDIVQRTLEQGAQGFIAKPFQKQDLLRYINISPEDL